MHSSAKNYSYCFNRLSSRAGHYMHLSLTISMYIILSEEYKIRTEDVYRIIIAIMRNINKNIATGLSKH